MFDPLVESLLEFNVPRSGHDELKASEIAKIPLCGALVSLAMPLAFPYLSPNKESPLRWVAAQMISKI